MLSPSAGPALAATFGLGRDGRLTGPVARGEQGQVWRLDTERGAFAVKDPFVEMSPAAALADADYQDAVLAAGVPMPEPLRTPDGRVLVEVEGSPARTRHTSLRACPSSRATGVSVSRPAAAAAALSRVSSTATP